MRDGETGGGGLGRRTREREHKPRDFERHGQHGVRAQRTSEIESWDGGASSSVEPSKGKTQEPERAKSAAPNLKSSAPLWLWYSLVAGADEIAISISILSLVQPSRVSGYQGTTRAGFDFQS
ncbi:hypothetical protein PTI98_000174 [Pleurotus ostreatus]|nr:hypothetical protein PTI98_000174 [Pleurotus ostreatus]